MTRRHHQRLAISVVTKPRQPWQEPLRDGRLLIEHDASIRVTLTRPLPLGTWPQVVPASLRSILHTVKHRCDSVLWSQPKVPFNVIKLFQLSTAMCILALNVLPTVAGTFDAGFLEFGLTTSSNAIAGTVRLLCLSVAMNHAEIVKANLSCCESQLTT